MKVSCGGIKDGDVRSLFKFYIGKTKDLYKLVRNFFDVCSCLKKRLGLGNFVKR